MNARKPAILITIDHLAALRESKDQIIIGAEKEVAGKTLIPLTTMVSGHPRSTTYFDRSTSLIAKETKCSLPRVQDPPETWKKRGPVEMETTYGDYKSFERVIASNTYGYVAGWQDRSRGVRTCSRVSVEV